MRVAGWDLEKAGLFPVHVHVRLKATNQHALLAGDAAHSTGPRVRVRVRVSVSCEGKVYAPGDWLVRNTEDVTWLD